MTNKEKEVFRGNHDLSPQPTKILPLRRRGDLPAVLQNRTGASLTRWLILLPILASSCKAGHQQQFLPLTVEMIQWDLGFQTATRCQVTGTAQVLAVLLSTLMKLGMLCTECPWHSWQSELVEIIAPCACKKSYPSMPEMMLALIHKKTESQLTVLPIWPYLKPSVRLIQKKVWNDSENEVA